MNVQQIEKEALKLSVKERAEIAMKLIASIDKNDSELSKKEIEDIWIDEAEARYEEYKKGNIKSYDLDEFIKEQKSRYK